jgi:UDP-N-acetyl-D-glucosamine dehydrogenase
VNDPVEFFKHESWTCGVVGLGYVGLPLALTAVARGHRATGFDTSADRVHRLGAGSSPIDDISDADLTASLQSGFSVTVDPAELAEADAIFICVPSPLGRNRQPDMTYIQSASSAVASVARPGQLIALESTTYPGTTDDILVQALSDVGLEVDRDVYVAFSPERVSPGDALKTGEIPKVVGGVSPLSTAVAAAAYGRLVPKVHVAPNAKTAEMAKLLENTYRAVNIGLINEMAQLAHEIDIDIWEVIAAAKTKPFGFQEFYPGPGVGGHCIPLDPQFLAWRAKEANFTTRFIDTAEQVNEGMPTWTIRRIASMLNLRGLPVFGTPVLGVGISYKPDIADDRESASVRVLKELANQGAKIDVFDPLVPPDRIREHGFEPSTTFEGYEAAVILTDHDGIDYAELAASAPIVFDCRDAYRRRGIKALNVEVL